MPQPWDIAPDHSACALLRPTEAVAGAVPLNQLEAAAAAAAAAASSFP